MSPRRGIALFFVLFPSTLPHYDATRETMRREGLTQTPVRRQGVAMLASCAWLVNGASAALAPASRSRQREGIQQR
ncbi:hypothetical protein P792_03475 [Asaia sp. SF2.1]|nr:hypothetical protein P792_03475 [Asaia sp. SF2.1]